MQKRLTASPLAQGLSVKAVSLFTGLTAHTLRAWERRYALIKPRRTPTGRRIYTMADVEKLKLLGSLTQQGHSIGNLVQHSLKDLEKLARQTQDASRELNAGIIAEHATHSDTAASVSVIIGALRSMNLEALDRHILKARLSAPARVFALEIISPLLSEVGALVARHELDIAQEHGLSVILRTHLGEVLAQMQRTTQGENLESKSLPRFLFSTPEGDLHEFGILLAAILAGSRGLSFSYLGPNMPAENLAKAAATTGAKIIVLGSVPADDRRLAMPLRKYIEVLSQSLSKVAYGTSIWIGGSCSFDLQKEKLKCPTKQLKSLSDFDQELEKLTE